MARISSARELRGVPIVFVILCTLAVGSVWIVKGPEFINGRPDEPDHTAAELRERPDMADVVADHAAATRAVLEAFGSAADLTWKPGDPQVFVHEIDGYDEQVVDGYPALRWAPEGWSTEQDVVLDEAQVAALARAFETALEPRGYDVSTKRRQASGRTLRKDVSFVASHPTGPTITVSHPESGGTVYVRVRTGAFLYRSDTCAPDPLTCYPTVEDPAAGL